MAINPLIALQSQVPDIGPSMNRLLDAVGTPEVREQRRSNQLMRHGQNEMQRISNAAMVGQSVLPFLQANNTESAVNMLNDFRERSDKMGVDIGIDDDDIEMVRSNPQRAQMVFQEAINLHQKLSASDQNVPTSILDRKDLLSRLPTDNQGNMKPLDQMTAAERAVAIEAGLVARAGTTSKDERIAGDPNLTSRVADSQAEISGAKAGAAEEAKLNIQKDIKPQIEEAVTLAREKAKGQGEAAVNLAQTQAALPGLMDVMGQLKSLAPKATYTTGGRAFNAAMKELGFAATDGATARAKFISIINNQVLPLLKPTFGAAFTVQEGESLKATMGDPNATPEEKIAQIDAFIEGKYREIETKARQLGIEADLPKQESKYSVGQIVTGADGKQYRVIGGDMNDPDVEPVQ